MKLSTKSRYASRILVRLAAGNGKLSLRKQDLSKCEGIQDDYVAQILLTLRKAGLVNSQRGPHGGFSMARDPARITILDVVEAMEGPIALVTCVQGRKRCARATDCVTRPVWEGAGRVLNEYLKGITIRDLATSAWLSEKGSAPTFDI